MPCSGLNSAVSFTPGASASASIVATPSRVLPVWFVSRPTRSPLSGANPSARSTSIPVWTGGAGAGLTTPAGACVVPRGQVNSRAVSAGTSVTADATIVARRARNGVTSPDPSGCTRLARDTMYIRVAGSIQSDVPVKPVWPNEPSGNSSPRFDE